MEVQHEICRVMAFSIMHVERNFFVVETQIPWDLEENMIAYWKVISPFNEAIFQSPGAWKFSSPLGYGKLLCNW